MVENRVWEGFFCMRKCLRILLHCKFARWPRNKGKVPPKKHKAESGSGDEDELDLRPPTYLVSFPRLLLGRRGIEVGGGGGESNRDVSETRWSWRS